MNLLSSFISLKYFMKYRSLILFFSASPAHWLPPDSAGPAIFFTRPIIYDSFFFWGGGIGTGLDLILHAVLTMISHTHIAVKPLGTGV